MKAKVLDRQSFIDIAIQHCGSVMAAYDIAHLNGLGITDELTPGQELALPEVVDKDVAGYFKSRRINPATYQAPENIFYPKYGALYNEWAASDLRNIASAGWRVPLISDYNALIDFLEGYSTTGQKLKEVGPEYWNTNGSATNEVKFNLRGAGIRQATGQFNYIKDMTKLRTMSDGFFGLASYYTESFGNFFISDFRNEINKLGSTIRLIKESTQLSHGNNGIYVGNDGKRYLTIVINNQEWLAGNLAETKFRNGDTIPEVTDASMWSGLDSAAWCAYNNDHSNI